MPSRTSLSAAAVALLALVSAGCSSAAQTEQLRDTGASTSSTGAAHTHGTRPATGATGVTGATGANGATNATGVTGVTNATGATEASATATAVTAASATTGAASPSWSIASVTLTQGPSTTEVSSFTHYTPSETTTGTDTVSGTGGSCGHTYGILAASVTVESAATGRPIANAVFGLVLDGSVGSLDAYETSAYGGYGYGPDGGPNGVYTVNLQDPLGSMTRWTVQISAPGYFTTIVHDVHGGYDGRDDGCPYEPGSDIVVKLTPIPDAG